MNMNIYRTALIPAKILRKLVYIHRWFKIPIKDPINYMGADKDILSIGRRFILKCF